MYNEAQITDQEPEPGSIKVYHYTTYDALRKMREGDSGFDLIKDPRTSKYIGSEEARGLFPVERVVPMFMSEGLEPESTEPAIYALLEPKDKNWFDEKIGKQLISHIEGKGKNIVLIEISLTPEQLIKTFVVEAAYYNSGKNDEKYGYRDEEEMYRNYWKSRIPIKDYLSSGSSKFKLPEVIILDRIDLDKMTVLEGDISPRE